MAEEVTQTIETDETNEGSTAGATQTEVSPEESIAKLEAALAERDARMAEMESTLCLREARIMELDGMLEEAEAALTEREGEIEAVKGHLAQAIALYRSSLLAAEPEVPEELVRGATIEEIEASLALARQMVEQVRSQLEAQASQERVPFGSPVRSSPDLSALSPQEKILLGLRRR